MPGRRELLAAGAVLMLGAPAVAAMRPWRAHLFGSPIELRLPAEAPPTVAADLLAGLSRLNLQWNAWKPGGELGALNAALAAGRTHRVSAALAAVLRDCARLETASLGGFNPALGALVADWGFHADMLRDGGSAPPPPHWLHSRGLERPSLAAHLEWRGATMLASRHPGLRIDLGAYAKGWAIDWALARLRRRHGVHDALLDLGGNLGTLGHARMPGTDAERAWRVGIRDPHDRTRLAAWLDTASRAQPEAVITSGGYERRRRLDDGRIAHHILDPERAAPAEGLASVTVVHRSAALADAAATALYVAGPARWREVARRMGVDQALAIDRDGRHEATPRLAARLQYTASA